MNETNNEIITFRNWERIEEDVEKLENEFYSIDNHSDYSLFQDLGRSPDFINDLIKSFSFKTGRWVLVIILCFLFGGFHRGFDTLFNENIFLMFFMMISFFMMFRGYKNELAKFQLNFSRVLNIRDRKILAPFIKMYDFHKEHLLDHIKEEYLRIINENNLKNNELFYTYKDEEGVFFQIFDDKRENIDEINDFNLMGHCLILRLFNEKDVHIDEVIIYDYSKFHDVVTIHSPKYVLLQRHILKN